MHVPPHGGALLYARFYNSTFPSPWPMAFNIALGDVDHEESATDNPYHIHHEQWFAGAKDVRTQIRYFGELVMLPKPSSP